MNRESSQQQREMVRDQLDELYFSNTVLFIASEKI
jgi:hypothetical protein